MSATTTPKATYCTECGARVPREFCPQCGARAASADSSERPAAAAAPGPAPAAPRPRPRWLPAALVGACVLAVAAIAAVLLVVLTASDDTPKTTQVKATGGLQAVQLAGQPLYAPRSADTFMVLLPAGWSPGRFASPVPLQSQVTAKSPQDDATSVSVGEIARRGGLGTQANAIIKSLRGRGGYQAGRSQGTTFPGGVHGWRVSYQLGGSAQLLYMVDYCDRRFAVVGATTPDKADQVKPRFSMTASTLQVTC